MLHGNLSVKEEITQTKCFRTTKNKTRRPCKKKQKAIQKDPLRIIKKKKKDKNLGEKKMCI